MGCTIQELIAGMVNAAKKNPRFVKMANDTSPVLDVTDILQKYYYNVKSAYLTIYGDPNRVRVLYKSKTMPPAQTESQIIYNWEHGIELERQHCLKDGLYYLVQYPAKLDVTVAGQEKKADLSPLLLFGLFLAALTFMNR